jgi:hypothetical protein
VPDLFTVEAAEHKADKPDTGYGPKQIINLSLKDRGGDILQAEWFTNASTSVPQPGTQLVGEISSSQYGLRFKKVASAASGFGPRPEDPQRQKRIVRQHSQSMALQAISLAFERGLFEPGTEPHDSKALFHLIGTVTDWFDRDVESAVS